MTTHHTITECLATLEVTTTDLEGCDSLRLEFVVIKKAYFKKVLKCHPDKGGDAAVFRAVHASFEALRDMYDNGRVQDSFVDVTFSPMDDNLWQEFADMQPQSWDYFYEASEEEVPGYCVELAKSGRSNCKQTGSRKKCTDTGIERGEIRCGSLDDCSGAYTRWNHLKCWRVPAKIWLGLPDPDECDDPELFIKGLISMNEVSIVGFSALPEEEKNAFVAHVMDKENWAKWTKRKPKKNDATIVPSTVGRNSGDSKEVVGEGYHAPRERFVVPIPGQNGAIAGILQGKTVVLTGVFPEVGGGCGLNLGKDKVKAMVQKFGGRVTSSISGKTDLLIVGKEAGHSKVSKAMASKKCKLVSLKDLKNVFEGTATLEDATSKPLLIPQFSAGYGGASALVAASGPMLVKQDDSADLGADKKPAAKRKALEDNGDKKPAAKKPKKAAGKKAAAARKKAAKRPRAKKEEKENAVNEVSDSDCNHGSKTPMYDITCDGCEVVCTKRSWHVEETEEDFCENCHDGNGVLQCNGINVE